MSRAPAVPDELRHAPFRGSAAVARGLVTQDRLRGATWRRLLRDVYVHRDVPLTPTVRIDALRLAVPADAVLCGRTAAWMYGVWEPPPGRPLPLEHTRPVTSTGRRLAGTSRRRLVLGDEVEDLGGVRATSPLRTCFELMRDRGLVEAVVAVDAFAAAEVIALPVLAAYVDAHRGWPGVRQARRAVGLGSARSRSPGESRLRMVVVLAGFPEPLVNVPVVAGRQGELLGYPDLLLLDVPRPAGLEYDGAYHEDAEQFRADLRRENTFLARTALPLLRYDGRAVRRERARIVDELTAVTGYRAAALIDADFRRPPPARAW